MDGPEQTPNTICFPEAKNGNNLSLDADMKTTMGDGHVWVSINLWNLLNPIFQFFSLELYQFAG